MKTAKTITMALAFAAVFTVSARGQGFQNLSFESAQNLPGDPPIPDGVLVSASNALPGWTAYGGDNVLADINYVSNYVSGVQTSVVLEGGSLALSGDFSVGLYAIGSISQTGLVPGNAESLQFEAKGPGLGGSIVAANGFAVTLGGQKLSYSALSDGPNYIEYGANIPAAMDNQMEALTFLLQTSGSVVLDNIEFSSISVPEPSTYALVGLGAILFGVRRLRRGIIKSQP